MRKIEDLYLTEEDLVVGKKLYSLKSGEVKVSEIQKGTYPVVISNAHSNDTYTEEGKYHHYDKYPTLLKQNPFEYLGSKEANSNSIIIDNRLVSNYTFANRLLSFVEGVNVADACSSDEKDMLINVAKKLLRHQVLTATDQDEINHLHRVNLFDKYSEPTLVTFDGVSLYEKENQALYSCMKNPPVGDQVLEYKFNDRFYPENLNPDRIFFFHKQNCLQYIDSRKPSISKMDLEEAGLLEEFEKRVSYQKEVQEIKESKL